MHTEICSVWNEKLTLGLSIYFCAVENLADFVLRWWEKIQHNQKLPAKRIRRVCWGMEHFHLFISSEKKKTDYIPKVHLLNWQFSTPGTYFHRTIMFFWLHYALQRVLMNLPRNQITICKTISKGKKCLLLLQQEGMSGSKHKQALLLGERGVAVD